MGKMAVGGLKGAAIGGAVGEEVAIGSIICGVSSQPDIKPVISPTATGMTQTGRMVVPRRPANKYNKFFIPTAVPYDKLIRPRNLEHLSSR